MNAILAVARSKAVAAGAAVVLGAVLVGGLVGGAAFAATTPAAETTSAAVPIAAQDGSADKDHGGAKLKAILDGLVGKGVITRAQADAILDAVAKAHPPADRDGRKHDFVGNVLKESATYLGLTDAQLKTALATGKSLAEVANATPGKNRQGLIDTLTAQANERIAQALKDGKITAEQAEKIRTMTSTAIVKIVDHERGAKPAHAKDKSGKKS